MADRSPDLQFACRVARDAGDLMHRRLGAASEVKAARTALIQAGTEARLTARAVARRGEVVLAPADGIPRRLASSPGPPRTQVTHIQDPDKADN